MLDVLVSQVVLDGTGVISLIGQLVPTGMARHMGMNRKSDSGLDTCAGNHLPNRRSCQGSLAFGDEEVRGLGIVPLQRSQSTDLRTSEGVHTGGTVLDLMDEQQSLSQVGMLPAYG